MAQLLRGNMALGIRVLLVTLILLFTAHAANYIVVNNADSGPSSLRQAILDVNAGGGGTIIFSNVPYTIDLVSGLPVLTANITISGPGISQVVISNSNNYPRSLLTNSAANTAAITGITISGGLDNYGTLVMSDALVGNQMSPSHPGLYNSGTATLSRCTFTHNGNASDADALINDGTMNIDHCSITNNQGGGDVLNYGTLTMDNSIVTGHAFFTSSWGGVVNFGGIMVLRNCSITNNNSVEGGGIWNAGSLSVSNCLISGNVAAYSEPGELGAGLYNVGFAILENTTISRNFAQGAGGGIWNGGSVRLLNCTIASNTAIQRVYVQSGGGGISSDTRAISISQNSIIAGNYSHDTNQTLIPDDISGYLYSDGHNLVLSTNGWPQAAYDHIDLLGVDPMLGPLQDNGGPTWTHALLTGSAAIDAGDPAGAPSEDQRGVPRPQGAGVDIGAFEYLSPNAIFTRIVILSKTNLLLITFAAPSRSYFVQSSPDLTSWNNIATLTAPPNGVLLYTNPITGPRCFFRLRPQSPAMTVNSAAASVFEAGP
jgi:hypothetical protein